MKNKSTLVSKNPRAYWKEMHPLYTVGTLTVKKNDGFSGNCHLKTIPLMCAKLHHPL